jgi:hypothetical protein
MSVLARWRARLATRKALLTAARKRYEWNPTKKNAATLRKRKEQVAYAERVIARHDNGPRIVTAATLGVSFDWVFGARGKPYRATGHYTAGPRAKNAEDGKRIAKQIHAQHRNQGWGGCSYDAIICDDGTLILMNPPGRKSAHVAQNNTGNAAVNCPGTTGDKPTAAQQDTFRWYLAHSHTSRVPKAHRQPVDLRKVRWYGHNDLGATACPGSYKRMFVTKGAQR